MGFASGFFLCILALVFFKASDKKTTFVTQNPKKSHSAEASPLPKPKWSALATQEPVGMEEEPEEADVLMPIEWEGPFLEVMTKKGQSMHERNDRLIKLATSEALGVPSVQEECLRHLAYGLSNEQQAEFLSLISNQNIPIELRKKFFSMLIEMKRPDELIGWLCKSISSQQERELLDEQRYKILRNI